MVRGSLANTADGATVASMGLVGSKAITGTSAVTPPTGYYFICIVPSSDMVVSAYTNSQDEGADLTAIASHPTGVPIYGKFTSITLTSGDGIGYLARG